MARIGVFICHCGHNIAGSVDIEKLKEMVSKIDDVVFVTDYRYLCAAPGQELLGRMIQEQNLDAVVTAHCSPVLHEKTFRNVAVKAGLNPYLLEVANIREQASWPHWHQPEMATKKAYLIIRETIAKVKRNFALEDNYIPVTKKALVIGGGVAGIQAALDIADGGYQVYLLEREPSLGGKMVQLSETFPTLDCPQCILTPKMTDVQNHPNIRIINYAEVDNVEGFLGNFKVRIRHRGSYVHYDQCTGCGSCEEVCPTKLPNEFERGLATRTAIYRPFPQAVPNVYTITKKNDWPPCRSRCPAHLNAQGYIAAAMAGRFDVAIDIIRNESNFIFAGVAGRICASPCEKVCPRGKIDHPVHIRLIKKFVADWEVQQGEIKQDLTVPEEREERIAIIGAGPAGLQAAFELRKRGYKVDVFEKEDKLGGGLWNLSDKILPKDVLKRECELVEQIGAKIHFNTEIGKDISFEKLVKDYDAVLISVGSCRAQREKKPGIDISFVPDEMGIKNDKGYIDADLLTCATAHPKIFAAGGTTGPMTFIDAVGAAKRAAESIHRFINGMDMVEGRERELPYDSGLVGNVGMAYNVGKPDVIKKKKELTSDEIIEDAKRCLSCAGCAECHLCEEVCDPKCIDHSFGPFYEEIEVGAIVVATGFELYPLKDIPEYGGGEIPDVIDALQFERLLAASGPTGGVVRRPSDGKIPKSVAFVHCVRSRDPEHGMPYCSRICCMYLVKEAILYKQSVPDGKAFSFYIDIRTNGKGYEEFYERARENYDIVFIRGKPARIVQNGDKVQVWGTDTLTGNTIKLDVDMVVLAPAMIPSQSALELIKKLRLATDEYGWVKEQHLKLRPLEAMTSGIFIAGVAQYPKDITDTVAQASGAASKVLDLFSQPQIKRSPIIARVDADMCAGCGYCEKACAYEAIKVDPVLRVSQVNAALCEGCGACAAACPSGAVQLTNFFKNQLLAMVVEATREYE